MNIQNIAIQNVTITSSIGAEISETDTLTLDNVNIINTDGSVLIFKNVKNINVSYFKSKDGVKGIASRKEKLCK